MTEEDMRMHELTCGFICSLEKRIIILEQMNEKMIALAKDIIETMSTMGKGLE